MHGRIRIEGASDDPAGLYFRTSRFDRDLLLSSADKKYAAYCQSCETVIMTNSDKSEEACLSCGTMMPPGVSVCQKCGWTYDSAAGSDGASTVP